MLRREQSERAGFTLVEVMITLMIMSMVLLQVYDSKSFNMLFNAV